MLHNIPLLRTFFLCLLLLGSARAEQNHTVVAWIEDLRSSTARDRLAAAYDYHKLTTIPQREVVTGLYQGANDADPYVRAHVVAALGELNTDATTTLPVLKHALLDTDKMVRLQAAIALSKFGGEAISLLVNVIKEGKSAFPKKTGDAKYLSYANCGDAMYVPRFLSAFALSQIGPSAALTLLAELKVDNKHKEPGVGDSSRSPQDVGSSISADNAIRSATIGLTINNDSLPGPYVDLVLSRMGESVLPTLFRALKNSSGDQRSKIIEILSRRFEIPVSRHLDLVVGLLSDSDTFPYAAEVLGLSGPRGLSKLRSVTTSGSESSQLGLVVGFQRALREDESVEHDLITIAEGTSSALVKTAVAEGFEGIPFKLNKTWSWFLTAAVNPDDDLRRNALNALLSQPSGVRAPAATARQVLPLVLDGIRASGPVRMSAMTALSFLGAEARPAVGRVLSQAKVLVDTANRNVDQDDELRVCIRVLCELAPPKDVLPLLIQLLGSKHNNDESMAIASIGQLGPAAESALPELSSLLDSKEYWESTQAGDAMISVGPIGQSQLVRLCRESSSPFRLAACNTLAYDLDSEESMRAVLEAITEPSLAKQVMSSLVDRNQQRFGQEDSDRLTPIAVFQSLTAGVNDTLPALKGALNDKTMSALAVDVVARFGPTAGALAPALESMLAESPSSTVKPEHIFNALRNIGTPGLHTLLQALQRGNASNLVLQAVASFGERGSVAVPFIKPYLSSKEPAVRTAAIGVLRESRVDPVMYSAAVVPLLGDTDADTRFQAASLLLESKDNRVVHLAEAALRQLVSNENDQIRLAAIEKIQKRGIRLSDDETSIINSIATDEYLSRLLETVQGEFYNEYFKRCESATIYSLPSFPWPPPQFSERDVIPRTFLGTDASALTEIDQRLDSALEAAGYGRGGLFSIPSGFVRVTKLERVDVSLKPLSGEYRWTEAPVPPRNLSDYLGQLFLEKPGVFRFIVFAVTDKWAEPSSTRMTFEQAHVLFLQGGLILPDEYKRMKFAGRQCYVLVYEFQKVTGRAWQVIPSPVNAKTQLMRAGVWSVLERG